jgi:ATP-dependent Clp endopeptidase proteolytic subunit ClpP
MTSVELLTFSMRSTPPKAGSDWFRIVEAKKGEATKVYIYDEIGFWGTTAKDFAAQLSEIDSDEIELHLNSPGGSVFDGLAIMAALKDHKAKVVAKVDGMAASAASFILQAADERLITRNAQVMIHDAKAYAGGNAAQMRKAAELLDRVSDNIADIYAVRSGQGTVESWRAIMVAGDEWYSGNEAVEAGLVDAVVDNPEEDEDEPEEASSNSWTTEEVEAFLQTPPEKLAASAKHVTITNRVEEAHMTGPNPQKTQPPAAPQPPAPTQQVQPAPTEAGVKLMVNGVEVTDLTAVQAHITALETFRTEAVEGARKEFVAKLAKDGKILANDETLSATETFALSLSPEQFAGWKATMDAAPSNNLFQQHGATQGDRNAPNNGGSQSETEARIQTLEEIVQSHRDAGLSQEQIETKASYKELQQLKSNQTGN